MLKSKVIQTIFIWLPSFILSVIFIQNGLSKVCYPDQIGKIVNNDAIIIIVGIILLAAVALFLFNKTIIWGASILTLYMTCITFIHLFKGKPIEVAALIVVGIIFATYLRAPTIFRQD